MRTIRVVMLAAAVMMVLSFAVRIDAKTQDRPVVLHPEATQVKNLTPIELNLIKQCEAALGLTDSQKKSLEVVKEIMPGHPFCCMKDPLPDDQRLGCLRVAWGKAVSMFYTTCAATKITQDSDFNIVFPEDLYNECGSFSSVEDNANAYIKVIKLTLNPIKLGLDRIARQNTECEE